MSDQIRNALDELVAAASNYVKPRRAVESRQLLLEALDAARAALAEQPSLREPLTDERIVELAEACGYDGAVPTVRLAFHGFNLWEFAHMVERAHGIGIGTKEGA